MPEAHAGEIVVSVDRTTRDWSDLAMGPPSTEDDADQSRKANVVFGYVLAHGKPRADAGARGFDLPRLNDGKFAVNGDDLPTTRGSTRKVIPGYSWISVGTPASPGSMSIPGTPARYRPSGSPCGHRMLNPPRPLILPIFPRVGERLPLPPATRSLTETLIVPPFAVG